MLQIPPACGEAGFDKTEESRRISAVPLVLGRIRPTKVEVKDDPRKEVISRKYWVGRRREGEMLSGSVCLRHQMPRGEFWELRPTW